MIHCPIHRFGKWVLEAVASRRLPIAIRSCHKCGKVQRRNIG